MKGGGRGACFPLLRGRKRLTVAPGTNHASFQATLRQGLGPTVAREGVYMDQPQKLGTRGAL
ncbi:hypothetical protein BDP55DRAFT_654784 [Colletotrichum godetiae]|uniref:Uncharacterized protein n=1 Tax=Colletotrichum godetiae TaxID=1209918 RepID=A0AAJ0EWY3_9PEZI|nr:uncharacterized protein BDP55DRAFT_654784 [Colletotrichum godetiae]KAK1689275.1 hypothetical protein BDP55DRAFT_654784 [Colletotrichum godetiae]